VTGKVLNSDEGKKNARKIRLQPILATLREGDRLRISISGSGWPAIGINPGQCQYLCAGPSPHCLVTTISLLLSNSKLKFESLISS
jgi:predicted acyl esterase